MNTGEMLRILDSIARDRNIDRELLISDLEQSMVTAARKHFQTLDLEEFTCSIDRLNGDMVLYRHGEPLELPPEDFGRIAAQTFKQVMIQRYRDRERDSLLEEFSKRVGQLVTGTAQRYDRGALIVQLDRTEAVMLRSEQIPGEQFAAGDRVRAMILDIKDMGSQVKIYLSRGNNDFIRRLFEVEVPEVAERIIEIKSMAREPGFRTKLAVSSIDSKVDAVGACVGVRGSRIKNIVDELNGEKIDIVRWNESSQILIANALKPAEVNEISLCFELGRASVVVRDDQLSLAIGKRGQNVRLAARLTGWDVDILTPDEFTKNLEIMSQTLTSIEGVSEDMVDRLAALGMVSVFDIEEVGAEVVAAEMELEEKPEIVQQVIEVAAAKAKEVAEQQAKEKAEQEARRAAEAEAAARMLESGEEPTDLDSEAQAAAILGLGGLGSASASANAPAAGNGTPAPEAAEAGPASEATPNSPAPSTDGAVSEGDAGGDASAREADPESEPASASQSATEPGTGSEPGESRSQGDEETPAAASADDRPEGRAS